MTGHMLQRNHTPKETNTQARALCERADGSGPCVKEEMAAIRPLLHAPASPQSFAGCLAGPAALLPPLHTSALALLQALAALEVSACQLIMVRGSHTWFVVTPVVR
jgi:hypothetical protein